MRFHENPAWLNDVVLSSTVARSQRRSEFYRAARTGRFVRLAEGVFLPATTWSDLDGDAQFLARIHAAALTSRPGLVFSHFSAAALWRLPMIEPWPSKPEVIVGKAASGPSRSAFTARQFVVPSHCDEIDGLTVTPLARTLIDIGRAARLDIAVAMMDRALALKKPEMSTRAASVTMSDLLKEFRAIDSPRGRTRCRIAIELADGASGSPGESLSRVAIHLLGLPKPMLQHPFYDTDGLIGYVDFWWPEFGLIGEFDGRAKYVREEMLSERTPADAVIAEKIREDRLRALGPSVTRWDWSVARSLPKLSRRLREAGLS